MPESVRVVLETGNKMVFVTALDWPGWSRGAKSEDDALTAFVDYAERYRTTIGTAARGCPRPKSPDDLDVVGRVKGDGSTDFGIPARPLPEWDGDVDAKDVRRRVRILEAIWAAFDAIAADAEGVPLQKGPRGGGRDVDKIVEHVLDAEGAYVAKVGGLYKAPAGAGLEQIRDGRRAAALEAIELRAKGEAPPKPPQRSTLWSLPYYMHRSAWHALDHAWEIEDKRLD